MGSEDDKKIIQEIRNLTDKAIIVDANEGWTDKYFALEMIQWLAERNVLLIEQPMPKEQVDNIAWLTSKSPSERRMDIWRFMPIVRSPPIQRDHQMVSMY